MDLATLVILFVGLLGALLGTYILYKLFSQGDSDMMAQLKNVSMAQRSASVGAGQGATKERKSVFESLKSKKAPLKRARGSKLTFEKKLKYAQWKMPQILFRILEVAISLMAFAIVSQSFNMVIQLISLLTGPLVMRTLLKRAIEKRFKAFDADYPQMLLSLVGLLKTGMNPLGALETAAQGLDEYSLVRREIEMMLSRLRYGVSEDRSIGSFGEDIFHPEIELFVQALLLSRRVGGTLSDTLDRLAKQVRKRQYFRHSAQAAVGMQRGSIWFIVVILVFMQVYLYFMYPQAITGAINDEMGWQVWQFGLIVISLGIFWVRQVTNLRV
jgi:tight adherence protein B